VSAAQRLEPGLASLAEAGDTLTPYATMYRYPDDPLEPEREQVEEALAAASNIYRFVLTVLPAEAHPPRAR